MTNQLSFVIAFFITLNFLAFLVMFWDKMRSRQSGAERISEGLLFFMATMFGSVGVYLGMFAFRHKTQKWYFVLGIPMLIAENLASLYVLSRYL